MGLGCFFKPAVELIQIVCQLLILYEEYQLLPSNRRLKVPKVHCAAVSSGLSAGVTRRASRPLTPDLRRGSG